MPEIDNGRITRIDFAPSGNLYVLVCSDQHEILYKIKVKHDFHRREQQTREKASKRKSLVQHDDLIEHGLIKEEEICEKVFKAERYRTIHSMFIVEQELGLECLETVITRKREDLTLLFRHSEEPDPIIKNYGFKVKSI